MRAASLPPLQPYLWPSNRTIIPNVTNANPTTRGIFQLLRTLIRRRPEVSIFLVIFQVPTAHLPDYQDRTRRLQANLAHIALSIAVPAWHCGNAFAIFEYLMKHRPRH